MSQTKRIPLEAKEATEAENFIMHPEVSQFSLAYCSVQIMQEKYIITSTQEGYFDKLCELTMAIFNFLRETPITQMGINTIHHYRLNDAEEWRIFGDNLSPKEMWRPFTKNPGLKRMEVMSQREDGLMGEINTTIGISSIPRLIYGIRIQVNDHYNLYTADELKEGKYINALKSLDVLELWGKRLDMALRIINGVMNYEKK